MTLRRDRSPVVCTVLKGATERVSLDASSPKEVVRISMSLRLSGSLFALSIAAVGCGGSSATPTADASVPRDGRVITNPGEEQGAAPPEADNGSVNEGSDAVGSCIGFGSETGTISLASARYCVDYNDGYTEMSAEAHCMGLGGSFRAGMGCDRTNSRLVESCTRTDAGNGATGYFYRLTSTRMVPDPPALSADDVRTWCMANGWTPPAAAMETPTNTGSCSFRSASNFVSITDPGVDVCVNYDSGYTTEQAQADCMAQSDVRSGRAPSFAASRSCSAGNATLGCRFTADGKTRSVRYAWGFRSEQPWSADDFNTGCMSAGGTAFTGL